MKHEMKEPAERGQLADSPTGSPSEEETRSDSGQNQNENWQSRLPRTNAYLSRVGTSWSNFRRAEKKERDGVSGYPRLLGMIRFDSAGEVTVSGDVDQPTDDEQAAIAAEFAAADLPRFTPLTAIGTPPPGVDLSSPDTFICHNFDGDIAMVLQRIDKSDGTKDYLPWTKWSDGKWRRMEPDGPLPFFGIKGHGQASTLILHEGAKAARAVLEMLSGERDADRLPWLEALRHAQHVGWLGGVFSVRKSDWATLNKSGWTRVIIVADNDDEGLKAAAQIAPHFKRGVSILAFDQRWPAGFDLADPFPKSLYDQNGRYIGPSFSECLRPATQATRVSEPEGRGRPTVHLRDEFASDWATTLKPPFCAHKERPHRLHTYAEFNALVSPFSHLKDTAGKLMGHLPSQHDAPTYEPGKPSGTLIRDGQRLFNTSWRPSWPKCEANAAPFLQLLDHLFPDEADRHYVMRWCATLIARPDIRMLWALLLISETQGVGKTTLGNLLSVVIGAHNASFPSEHEVLEAQFNGWIAGKSLVVVNEVYSGQSAKAYDKLKPFITDSIIRVNEKHIQPYDMPNWAHFMMCSNSTMALRIVGPDRRLAVPKVREAKLPQELAATIYSGLAADLPAAVMHWANDFVEAHGSVRAGEAAPDSAFKAEVQAASRSEGVQIALDLAELITGYDEQAVIGMRDLREAIARRRGFTKPDGRGDISHRYLEKTPTILSALREVEGLWFLSNTGGEDDRRMKINGVRDTLILNFDPGDAATPDLRPHLTTLRKLGDEDEL